MTQSEAILEYIDGTLDHDAEQSLFEAMARQPELRATLRQFVSIGAAVHADREAYAPPPDVERALMANLGLTPNASMPGTGAGSGGGAALGGASTWFGTFGGWMVSFLLGFAIAGGGVYLAMRDTAGNIAADRVPSSTAVGTGVDAGRLPATSDVPSRSGDVAAVASSPSVSAPAIAEPSAAMTRPAPAAQEKSRSMDEGRSTSRDRSASIGNGAETVRQIDAPATTQRSAVRDGALGDGTTPLTVPTIDPAPLRSSLSSPAVIQSGDDDDAARLMPASLAPMQSSPADPATGRNFVLEMRTNFGSSFKPTDARATAGRFSSVEDMAVGFYGHVNDAFMIGVEGGVETYDQTLHYEGRLVGDTSTVEQRPRYGWGGISGRAYLGTIPGIGIQTFGQMTLGGTSVGLLGRFRLGGSYEFGSLALTLGMETSAMSYTFNGRPQVSGRWGGTIGGELRL